MAAAPERYLDKLIEACQSVFDQVLILDYDRRPARARLELIPHRHGKNKASLELTEEIDCADFVAWVRENVSI